MTTVRWACSFDDRPNRVEKRLRARIVLPGDARCAGSPDAAQDGDDARRSLADQVPHEHRLELEGVLALVIEDVGERIERRTRRDAHRSRRSIDLDGTERRSERLATKREGLAHRRVRGAERTKVSTSSCKPRAEQP